jgi:hypothetical protein
MTIMKRMIHPLAMITKISLTRGPISELVGARLETGPSVAAGEGADGFVWAGVGVTFELGFERSGVGVWLGEEVGVEVGFGEVLGVGVSVGDGVGVTVGIGVGSGDGVGVGPGLGVGDGGMLPLYRVMESLYTPEIRLSLFLI